MIRIAARARTLLVTGACVCALAAAAYFSYAAHRRLHHEVWLPDETHAVYRGDSILTPDRDYLRSRHLVVDGDIYLNSPAADRPLLITTRLLKLTVTGPAVFRLSAFAKEAGEQVQVLCGRLTARKNYASKFDQPDELAADEMSMINQSVDLMEKETFRADELTSWLAGLGLPPPRLETNCAG